MMKKKALFTVPLIFLISTFIFINPVSAIDVVSTDFESGTLEGWSHENTRNYPNNAPGRLDSPGLGGSSYAMLFDVADSGDHEEVGLAVRYSQPLNQTQYFRATVKPNRIGRTIAFNMRDVNKVKIVKVNIGGYPGHANQIQAVIPDPDEPGHGLRMDTGLTFTANEEFVIRIRYNYEDGTFNVWKNGDAGNGRTWTASGGARRTINYMDIDTEHGFGKCWVDNVTIGTSGTPPPPPPPPPPPETPQFETGEVSVDHNWVDVEFSEAFSDPVVVAKPLGLNGEQPAVVRIRNVDNSGFEIRLQEWDYQDGVHNTERVSYLVMEQGSYTLNNGTLIEAGTFETNRTSSYENVTFEQPFQTVPVVMAAISSFNGEDAVTGRMRDITIRDFEFRMQEQEFSSQIHYAETISYIAWEPSSGNIDGHTFEINRTGNVVTHNFHNITFNQSFATGPMFLADMQTTDGINPANVRWRNKNAAGVQVQIDEEQSEDIETDHMTEVVGYMVFSQ